MRNHSKLAAALALVLASPAALSGCGMGCGAELSVEPVTIVGHGRRTVDLPLEARLTNDGDLVVGAKVEFFALGPNGVILGTATTGSDGVARLNARNVLGPDSINGRQAPTWTSYAARVSILQSTDAAADAICADQAEAPFKFTP
ncbi:hypothetical protein GCM10029976_035610 [Kribbella albertanoniae]|uniref:Lipoprotein n=1 Tax=Kribbella albertanoniae TaxID=1266829 RepID=A0A4R4QCT3_9ACTN|nr:hypothetical protein [Kribbella albertanoniae]TDC32913.1 hypothetical protein E1261_07235 [Kribbella albertanoniae]